MVKERQAALMTEAVYNNQPNHLSYDGLIHLAISVSGFILDIYLTPPTSTLLHNKKMQYVIQKDML